MTMDFANRSSKERYRSPHSNDLRNKKAFQYIEKIKLRDIINQMLDIRRMTSEYLQKKLRRFFYMDLIILWISSFLYLIYLYIPLLCLEFAKKRLMMEFQRASKSFSFIQRIVLWINCFIIAGKHFFEMLVNYPVCEIVLPLCKVIVEVYLFIFNISKPSHRKNTSDNLYAELISYEEIENDSIPLAIQQKITDRMHHKIPLNKFRAVISPTFNNNINRNNSNHLQISIHNNTKSFSEGSYSPLSFPTSPLSRAMIMNKYASRVENLMFTARDLLRIDSQSKSSDEFSRISATNFMKLGTFAIFDSTYISDALSLNCGNHCVELIHNVSCASCRSMVPVPINTFVYFEFTITASTTSFPSTTTSNNSSTGISTPIITIGLTPPDSPLNIFTGTWPRSIALCSDNTLLVCGKKYPCIQPLLLVPGCTIGMLVLISESYFPSPVHASNKYIDPSGSYFPSDLMSPTSDTIQSNNLSNKCSTNSTHSSNNNGNRSRSSSSKSNSNSNSTTSSNASTVIMTLTKPHWILKNLMKTFSFSEGSRNSNRRYTSQNRNNNSSNSSSSSNKQSSISSQSSHSNAKETRRSQSDNKINTMNTYPNLLQDLQDCIFDITTQQQQSSSWSQSQLQLQSDILCQDDSINPIKLEEEVDKSDVMKIDVHSPPPLPPPYTFFFKYNINGIALDFPIAAIQTAATEVADLNSPLFPSVSLSAKDTKIWSRFCADDILHRQRVTIGAPPGTRVYSLDGSLLLSEFD